MEEAGFGEAESFACKVGGCPSLRGQCRCQQEPFGTLDGFGRIHYLHHLSLLKKSLPILLTF